MTLRSSNRNNFLFLCLALILLKTLFFFQGHRKRDGVCTKCYLFFAHLLLGTNESTISITVNMFKRALLHFGHKRAAKSTILTLKVKPAGKNKHHYCFRINNVYIHVLSLSLGQTRWQCTSSTEMGRRSQWKDHPESHCWMLSSMRILTLMVLVCKHTVL